MATPMNYSLRVWLTAVLIGPILFFTIKFAHNNADFSSFVMVYFIAWLMGFVLSLPTFLIFTLSINLLLKTSMTIQNLKLMLVLISFFLTILTFIIVIGRLDGSVLELSAAYWICLLVGIFFYPLEASPKSAS